MHYYSFHIGDYQSHTAHLSEMEDLAYRRMLDWYYLHEKPLPLEVEEIARVTRMRTHCECIAVVLREFFERTADGWINARADEELTRLNAKSEKARASAQARWLKTKEKSEDANAMRTHCEGNATNTQYPIPNTHITELGASPKGDAQDKKPPREKRATRLPDDWELPDDYAQWCREKRPDLNPYKVADQFKDYWVAQPGARARKADWFATWRNWCRNQKAENQTLSFAERDEQAKANWYAQASGRTPVYEPDIFDMAVAESRQHLRIAK